MPNDTLTACLIVQDEQAHLPDALASVSFCDEIVVVDGGSTDRTVEIAKAAGARVVENRWPGFAAQRNVALDAATCEWVLELDADERVSPALRADIEALLDDPPNDVRIAVCPLRHRFLGRLLGPSAKYPMYRARLFRRGAYRHDEGRLVHEGIEPRERPAILEGDLEHELAASIREALLDARHYARLESTHIDPPRGARPYVVGILLRPLAKLMYRTAIDGGWRDGRRGLFKIALDVGSDALVWMLVLTNRPHAHSHAQAATSTGPTAQPDRTHFGRRPAGTPKVVAIAHSGRDARTAAHWLEGLAASGIDAVLLSDGPASANLATRHLRRLSPLQAIKALDVEMQVRTAHAVVPVGRRAKVLARVLPATLLPTVPGLRVDSDPEHAAGLIRAAIADS